MARHEWTIRMAGADLLPHARQQLDFHTSRLSHWMDQLARSKEAVKAAGIEVIDSPEAELFGNNTVSYHAAVRLNVNPELAQRMEDCKRRVRDHGEMVKEFGRWILMFEHDPQQAFAVDISDMEHFGL